MRWILATKLRYSAVVTCTNGPEWPRRAGLYASDLLAGHGSGAAIELEAPQVRARRFLRSGWHRTFTEHLGREKTLGGNQDAAHPDGEPLAQPTAWCLRPGRGPEVAAGLARRRDTPCRTIIHAGARLRAPPPPRSRPCEPACPGRPRAARKVRHPAAQTAPFSVNHREFLVRR